MTLKEDKTVIFSSPLDNNGEFKLVRTGSVKEDNLFHCALYCTSRKFIRRNNKERLEMIKELKDKIGSIVNFEFLRNFYRDIELNNTDKYKFIKNDNDYEAYKIFCEMFPYKKLLSLIKIQSLDACKIYCKNNITRLKVEESHKKFLLEKMEFLLHDDVDIFFTKLSQFLEINIYILEKSTLLPGKKVYGRGKRKSIVLFNDDNIYQPVGILLKDNRVNREFDHEDKVIKMLYALHNDKDKVKKKYPFLLGDKREESSSSEESEDEDEDEDEDDDKEDEDKDSDQEKSEHTSNHSSPLNSNDDKIARNFLRSP